jgi:OOP family OmpA-OmpF porin
VRWLAGSLFALTLALSLTLASAASAADDAPAAATAAPENPPIEAAPSVDPAAPSVDSAPPVARRVVLRGVKFGSDTAYIEPASAGVLELVAEQLRENPQVRVRIEGYTDETASDAHNLELSHERAESVKRILVGFGVEAARLEVVGMGEARPIAPNDTEEGRALNRRVELDVIE